MRKFLHIFSALILFPALLGAQSRSFMENQGQWEGDFDFKWKFSNGSVFLDGNSFTVHLKDAAPLAEWHGHFHHPNENEEEDHPKSKTIQNHAYRVVLENANPNPEIETFQKQPGKHHFIKGNRPENWRSNISTFAEIIYKEVWQGIDLRYYFSPEGNFKYDFILHPKANPKNIKLVYEKTDGLQLENGALIIKTSVENGVEAAPLAYQDFSDGSRKAVPCDFGLNENEISFQLENYDRRKTLVIDPELVFSSFTGSGRDNWGFTATPGADGSVYGGGIVFSAGGNYPVLGAFQDTFQGGDVDVAISKFSPDGSTLIYSTYLGGDSSEVPASLIETIDKGLVILGTTGSRNFPVTANAFDTTFGGGTSRRPFSTINYAYGSDIYITHLDSTGGALAGSTFLGGSANDGFNELLFNYGDLIRGEVIADSVGQIFIASSTASRDMPVTDSAFIPAMSDSVNGFAACLSNDLSNMNWGTYLGGSGDDNALSLKLSPVNQHLYVTGTTSSDSLGFDSTAYAPSNAGGADGYLMELDANTGQRLGGTFNGTSARDANFFVEVDNFGDVYIFGQTRGAYPTTSGKGLYENPGSSQFLQQFKPDLQSEVRATVFGDGQHSKNNIAPTALMVDDCGNLYLSGWGGGSSQLSSAFNQGTTDGLPVTDNAFQSTTDGEDFYFFVLDASWKKLNYASYFGRDNDTVPGEHVDGGTSRFAKDGTIYQAVCAGCGGSDNFPTTAGAYSQQNGGPNCNLAVVKFNFEAFDVVARFEPDKDSTCVPYTAVLTDKSFNADIYVWEFPDGSQDTTTVSQVTVTQPGTQSYRITGIDTTCGFRDTTTFSLFGFRDTVVARFALDFDSCSNDFEVTFQNFGQPFYTYSWDFGDGQTSTLMNPTHLYSEADSYEITLVAENPFCERKDSLIQKVSFVERISDADFTVEYDPCRPDEGATFEAKGTGFQLYEWDVGSAGTARGRQVTHPFSEAGIFPVRLTLTDTLCSRFLQKDTVVEFHALNQDFEMPNIFTPNGDGVNDFFGAPLDFPNEFLKRFSLKVYNRWGAEVFASADPKLKWDGQIESNLASEAVYFYLLDFEDACGFSQDLRGFVHLVRGK